MAHTPGPWVADEYEVHTGSLDFIDFITLVAETNSTSDAQLIAAAPEGHGILKDIAACVVSAGECRITNDEQFKRILDYLAKAEGRS